MVSYEPIARTVMDIKAFNEKIELSRQAASEIFKKWQRMESIEDMRFLAPTAFAGFGYMNEASDIINQSGINFPPSVKEDIHLLRNNFKHIRNFMNGDTGVTPEPGTGKIDWEAVKLLGDISVYELQSKAESVKESITIEAIEITTPNTSRQRAPSKRHPAPAMG